MLATGQAAASVHEASGTGHLEQLRNVLAADQAAALGTICKLSNPTRSCGRCLLQLCEMLAADQAAALVHGAFGIRQLVQLCRMLAADQTAAIGTVLELGDPARSSAGCSPQAEQLHNFMRHQVTRAALQNAYHRPSRCIRETLQTG
eukprot:1160330-Pelagomonas_calceolata.AAC.8